MTADVTALLSLLLSRWEGSRHCACRNASTMFPPPRIHPAAAACQARQNVVDVGQKGSLGDVVARGTYVVKTATKGMVLVPRRAVSHGERGLLP
jgi:hypothetical protein